MNKSEKLAETCTKLNEFASFLEGLFECDRADSLRSLSKIAEDDEERFIREVNGIGIWGGAGSISDWIYDDSNWKYVDPRPPWNTKDANQAHRRHLVELAETMSRAGICSRRVDDIRRILASWNAQGC